MFCINHKNIKCIKVILDTRSKNNAGKHPVKLRFTSGTKSAYVTMSMFAFPEDRDEDTYFTLKNKETKGKIQAEQFHINEGAGTSRGTVS